jgi:hypothetical protein
VGEEEPEPDAEDLQGKVAEDASSHGTMFDYENSDSEIKQDDGVDSPQTPKSGKYSQDEEFTDPEDPVTVVKTSLHIDTVTEKEELERKIKYREDEEEKERTEIPALPPMEYLSSLSDKLTKTKFTLDDIEHQDERLLLDKYRLNIVELKAKKDEKLEDPEIAVSGDDENEDEIIDADLICKSMVKKRRDKSTKKEL